MKGYFYEEVLKEFKKGQEVWWIREKWNYIVHTAEPWEDVDAVEFRYYTASCNILEDVDKDLELYPWSNEPWPRVDKDILIDPDLPDHSIHAESEFFDFTGRKIAKKIIDARRLA